MNRRKFIKSTSAIDISSLTIPSMTLDKTINKAKQKNSNEEFTDNFELNEITIDELQKKMHSGEYTSRQITEMYLKRMEEIDKKGPAINSVIELNPDALSIADKMDDERQSGKIRGLIHGIPVLIKDNI